MSGSYPSRKPRAVRSPPAMPEISTPLTTAVNSGRAPYGLTAGTLTARRPALAAYLAGRRWEEHFEAVLTPTELGARTDQRRQPAYWGAYRAYTMALKEAGVMVGGSGLQPPAVATTVRPARARVLQISVPKPPMPPVTTASLSRRPKSTRLVPYLLGSHLEGLVVEGDFELDLAAAHGAAGRAHQRGTP